MLQLVKQIAAAEAVSISQTNPITTGIGKHCVYAWTHSYYDMGVAMVDCVIVIVYTLHVCGPLELQLFLVHCIIKRRQQRHFALEI